MPMDRIGTIYRTSLVVVFRAISIVMMMVGFVITLCVLADNMFGLGWGYPWWSLLFCVVYIGIAVAIYRSMPGFVGYIERLRNGNGRGDGSV